MSKFVTAVWVCFLVFVMEFSSDGWEADAAEPSAFAGEAELSDFAGADAHGFREISREYIPALGGEAIYMEHAGSGARLLYVDADDSEKTFGVGFRTVATDDTGVNHIIEHCLLGGSERSDLKNPFVYLANHSSATFLNAMTFPDFTLYALASRDEDDYRALIKTYLDGIFFPRALAEPNIFRREGWRLEWPQGGELKFNGTVLNEMKGAYSADRAYLARAVMRSLFPDTQYRYDSGGVPAAITRLTYGDFLKTYAENYVPSNALIFIYGRQDVGKTLKLLDENYLSFFPAKENDSARVLNQPAFEEPKLLRAEYPCGSKATLAASYAVCDCFGPDMEKLELLTQALDLNDESPLKKDLAARFPGALIQTDFYSIISQCVLSVVISGIEPSEAEAARAAVRSGFERLSRAGLPQSQFKALKNRRSFSEALGKNMPQRGINANIQAMAGFIYGGGPAVGLGREARLEKAVRTFGNKDVKRLVSRCILNNPHASVVLMTPMEPAKAAEVLGGMDSALRERRKSLSKEEAARIKAGAAAYAKWLEEESSGVSGAGSGLERVLPDGICRAPDYTEEAVGAAALVHTDMDTHGVASLHLMFDASALPQGLIPYAQVLAGVMGSYSRLSVKDASVIGSLRGYMSVDYPYCDSGAYTPRFNIEVMALDGGIAGAVKALSDEFDPMAPGHMDRRAVRTFLAEAKAAAEADYDSKMPLTDCLAMLTGGGRYTYEIDGFGYYIFVNALLKYIDSDDYWPMIERNLLDAKRLILNQAYCTASFTGSAAAYEKCKNALPDFMSTWGKASASRVKYRFPPFMLSIPALTSSTRSVVHGGRYDFETADVGSLLVTASLVNAEYLWPQVRDMGGAYGAGASVQTNGTLLLRSYRDPNPERTRLVYGNIPEFLENADVEDMDYPGLRRHILASWDEQWQGLRLWDYGAKVALGMLDPARMGEIREQIKLTMPWDAKYDAEVWREIMKNGTMASRASRQRTAA
ncbi:MAG: insulinase family protein [Firmicutes bacterium]|nr:insulinase family protein [Bacillota bacterium]